MSLNELSKKIHQANREKGFYEEIEAIQLLIAKENSDLLKAFNQTLFASRIALLTSEASEALEANRKSNQMQMISDFQKDSVIPEMCDEVFIEWFSKNVKDTEEDELADVAIRLLDEVGRSEVDIDLHIEMKLRFNSLRPKKHGKEY